VRYFAAGLIGSAVVESFYDWRATAGCIIAAYGVWLLAWMEDRV
jgi:hypothetical protein